MMEAPDSAFVESVQGGTNTGAIVYGLASQITYTIRCNFRNRSTTISGVFPSNKRPNGSRSDTQIEAANPGDPVIVQVAGDQLRFFIFEAPYWGDCQ